MDTKVFLAILLHEFKLGHHIKEVTPNINRYRTKTLLIKRFDQEIELLPSKLLESLV